MYEIERTETFMKWLLGLKDAAAIRRIAARIERAKKGNFGSWKPVGGEVREMRIDCGSGYRIYYTIRNSKIIFLLSGGDKRTQHADIEKAQKLAKEI
ncbi:MAG: type II toxin-antitoxin system RelE/ParE family toxin [Treponemataceae bacterium]|nr:MAG: type II toxin-antitoxin system RelE/ParE family toxin [Treponemataceae bacterium]